MKMGKMNWIEAKHFKDFDIKARQIDDVEKIIDKLKADGFVFFHDQPYVEVYKNKYAVQFWHLK